MEFLINKTKQTKRKLEIKSERKPYNTRRKRKPRVDIIPGDQRGTAREEEERQWLIAKLRRSPPHRSVNFKVKPLKVEP